MSEMFNDAGQMNASSCKEVFLNIEKLFKCVVDYRGFSRDIFMRKNLTQGEQFVIQGDVMPKARIYGGNVEREEDILRGKFVRGNSARIGCFPVIDLSHKERSLYDIDKRVRQVSRQQIELQEDKYSIDVLDGASRDYNKVINIKSLDIDSFESLRFQIEKNRLPCSRVMINNSEIVDIVKNLATYIEPVTDREEILLNGTVGELLGTTISVNIGIGDQVIVPKGTMYAISKPEYLGVFADYFSSESEKPEIVGDFCKWSFVREVGVIVANNRAVAKAVKE